MSLQKKKLFKILLSLAIVIGLCGVYEVHYLKIAHSTFENYYSFRGCTELVERTDTYGLCKLKSGQIIKLVKFDNRWFLDGDLPCGLGCF